MRQNVSIALSGFSQSMNVLVSSLLLNWTSMIVWPASLVMSSSKPEGSWTPAAFAACCYAVAVIV